jgi:hypothetical protein
MPNRSPPGSRERSSARRPTAPKTPCTPNLVLSVPSDRFGAALDELRGLGEEVTTDTISGQDVTEEFVD